MDWETIHSKAVKSPQIYLQLECNCRQRQIHSKNYVEKHRTQNSLKILTKKNQVGRITLPNIKSYYTATIMKTVVLAEGQTHSSMKETQTFQQRILEQLGTHRQKQKKKINLDLNLPPYMKMNSKCTTKLNVKNEIIKLLEKRNIKGNWYPCLSKEFSDLTSKA